MALEKYRVYALDEIEKKRKYIYNTLIQKYGIKSNFTVLSSDDLENIGKLYDDVFFDGQIYAFMKKNGYSLTYQVTHGGKTTSAGFCAAIKTPRKTHCFFRIVIPIGVYFKLFNKGEKELRTNGLICVNRLNCLQLTFEHELIHLLMTAYDYQGKVTKGPGKQIYSAHGKLFRCMAYAYFGHTEFVHNLFAGEASEILTKEDFEVGRGITVDIKGVTHGGLVTKILTKNIEWVEIYPIAGRKWRSNPGALKKMRGMKNW